MGNNCVGSRISRDALFPSISSSSWWSRPTGDTVSPTSKSSSRSEGTNASETVQNMPPQVLRIHKVEMIPIQEIKPPQPQKHDEDNISFKAPMEESRLPLKVEVSHNDDDGPISMNVQKEETIQQVEPTKPKKSNHVKRISSAGLRADSVLQTKTGHLKEFYKLGRKLGHGQFGTSFLCVEKGTGKEYACKSIAKRKLLTREDVEDVRREIQIMHHLAGSSNVISIKGAYEDPVAVHVVMELCAGGELFDRIVERGHYTERKAAKLARTVVSVIEACHSLGVMHRDLKPENFLFVSKDEDSPLKAIDFGLSTFFKPGIVNVLQKIKVNEAVC